MKYEVRFEKILATTYEVDAGNEVEAYQKSKDVWMQEAIQVNYKVKKIGVKKRKNEKK